LGTEVPRKLRNPPPPTIEQIKTTLVFLNKKRRRKKSEGERPALFEVLDRDSHEFRLLWEFGTGTTEFGVGLCLDPEGWTVQP